jgi:hypothetical protein
MTEEEARERQQAYAELKEATAQKVEQIQAHADAGVEELIFAWFDQVNIEALRGFAESILPRV